MSEQVWLTEEDCRSFHGKLLACFGGSAGVRDRGLLLSALARPQQIFAYETQSLFSLAAAYAHGIVRNHPCRWRSGDSVGSVTVTAQAIQVEPPTRPYGTIEKVAGELLEHAPGPRSRSNFQMMWSGT
jgi:hypothetical protein